MGETLVVAEPSGLLAVVGATLGPTNAHRLSAAEVDAYRAATGDASPGEVPHFLLLSMINRFLPELLTVTAFSMGINVGLGSATFPESSPREPTIQAEGDVVEAIEIGDAVQVVVRVRLLCDGSVVCEADTISRFVP